MPVPISVVVPAYNMEKYLEAALSSIARQTMRDFECIVVDDFSTDGTRAIAARYRRIDPRFRLVTHRANGGLSSARNSGLRAASGEYVAFLDADDMMTPNSLRMRLEACRRHVERDGRWAGVYCGTKTVQENTKVAPPEETVSLPNVGFPTSGGVCPFNANQPMIRRAVLLQVGGFDESLRQAEDYDLWMRIMRAGYWFVGVPRVGVAYRARQGSMVRHDPLAHLSLSMGFFEAANMESRPRAVDQAVFGLFDFPIPYQKPVDAYAFQFRKAARVLEFVGMAMAGSHAHDIDTLADLVLEHLPDIPLVIAPGERVLDRMLEKGIRRQSGDVSANAQTQIDVLKAVVASRLRERLKAVPPECRQSEAERLTGAIYFFPQSRYHAWTIELIAPELREAGLPFVIVDVTVQRRDGGVRQKVKDAGLLAISYSQFILGRHRPGLVVVFNDWDHTTRPVVAAARAAGIPNMAIVEGIQDYRDVDVGRRRQPYQTADTVLLPGAFDRQYFADGGRQRLYEVGIPRIKHLRENSVELPRGGRPVVLINSNFSYNVLTEHRDDWVRSAVAAVRKVGLEPVISRHPGDVGREHPELVTTDDFYTALSKSTVTVQRFASGILEALAIGRGVVYFNPHGEQVDKFTDPLGAFGIATTPDQLAGFLADWDQLIRMAREKGGEFLDLHAGRQGESTTHAIVEALESERNVSPHEDAIRNFHKHVANIDLATAALTNGVQIFLSPEETYIREELGRLEEMASQSRAVSAKLPALSALRPIWWLRTGIDSLLISLYRREKERNSALFKWAQPLARAYRKFIAPY